MNFDFIKDLTALKNAYESCNNAEELAMSKPDLSMVASRKSAEVLARFVYFVAHRKEAVTLTFSDLLSNDVVKSYLRHNKNIMDAFHHVRKKGNSAAHTLDSESSENAVSVLRDLHYLFGEIAKRMGLIARYPKFNPDIDAKPDAQFQDIDIYELAEKMNEEHVVSQHRVEILKREFSELISAYKLCPGEVELNEMIQFNEKPCRTETITKIQEYFGFLAMNALNPSKQSEEEYDVTYSAELTIYGENGYTTNNLIEFAHGLFYDLPKSNGFKINSNYSGPSIAPWFNDNVSEEFRNTVSKLGESERFSYQVYEFLYNHGMGGCSKYENGKWIDLKSQFTADIAHHVFENQWTCWNIDLYLDFDFDKHSDILTSLQNAVRKHVPSDQVLYCENAWADGDYNILLNSISWTPNSLHAVQKFLDEINAIIKPIIAECDGSSGDFGWCQTTQPFAIADFVWTEKGFEIQGVIL